MASPRNLAFPTELVLTFAEESTGKPIPRLAARVTLHARRKNDYNLGPSLSDREGRITVRRAWVEQAIDETRAFFLMDYSSTLDDCLPEVDISVMTEDDISRAIEAAKVYVGVKQDLGVMLAEGDLRSASNSAYEPVRVSVSLTEPSERIEIPVRLRRRPSSA